MTTTANKLKKHHEVINNNQQAIDLINRSKVSTKYLLCLCGVLTTSVMLPDEKISDISGYGHFMQLPLEVERYCQRLSNEQRLMFAQEILNLHINQPRSQHDNHS